MDDTGRLSTADMRSVLLAAIDAAGGQNALARSLGINQGRIGEVVSGDRPVGAELARALGFYREAAHHVVYRPIEAREAVAD